MCIYQARRLTLLLAALSSAAALAGGVQPTFTYQGFLKDNQAAADGAYDFEFRLYDAAIGGNSISFPVQLDDVIVDDGLFTAALDFGADAFTGEQRWLEIAVRPGASIGAYTTLSPRQELTATPYAMALRLPYEGSVASVDRPALKIRQTGTREAGVFQINSPINAMDALTGYTDGSGLAIRGWTTGMGGVALLDIPIVGNPSDVIRCLTVGTGNAGMFEVQNPGNVRNAILARSNGIGYGLWAENLGPGVALMASATQAPGAEVVTQAGNVPALQATNMGGGIAVQAHGNIVTNRQIVSNVAAGTPPMQVASSTVIPNFNADMVDGVHGGAMMQIRTEGTVPAGGTLTLIIPHYRPWTLHLSCGWPESGGLALVHGFENDRFIGVVYMKYNGDGTAAIAGAEGAENSNTVLVTFGSGAYSPYRVLCPNEAAGDHNIVLSAPATGVELYYRLSY